MCILPIKTLPQANTYAKIVPSPVLGHKSARLRGFVDSLSVRGVSFEHAHMRSVRFYCNGVDSTVLCIRNVVGGRPPGILTLRNLLTGPSRVPAARRQTCSQHRAWLVF